MSNTINLHREQLVSEHLPVNGGRQAHYKEVLQAKIDVTIKDGHSKVMNMVDIGEITAIMEDAMSRIADALENYCANDTYRNPKKQKGD